MRVMGEFISFWDQYCGPYEKLKTDNNNYRIAYMINENSIQFNVVSKGLGCERMSFYLNEAAGDIRDVMMPTLEQPKSKL